MKFNSYNKIQRLNRECIIAEKLNGCFSYKSRVLTDKGYITIGKIVNQKLKCNVLSYNFNKKQFEWVKILNFFKKEAQYKEFIHIKLKGFKRGAAYYSFRCTPNHLILTTKGYKEARTLKIKDKVCSPDNPLTFIQQQMILGTLLGDAHIAFPKRNCSGYSHAQSIKHRGYSNLIKNLLGRFFSSERILKGGYSNTDIIHINSNFDSQISSYLKRFFKKSKYFTYSSLKDLSSIGLAFWYMDDGSCSFNKEQKPRMSLHTQGFSEKQINILLRIFKNKFNLYPKKKNYGKGFQLSFNVEDTYKFFDLIAPYIIQDLQYKLPQNYRTGHSYWDNYKENNSIFYEQEILEIKQNNVAGLEYHYKYDLETENHNYIVSGIVVHNSNSQLFIYDSNDELTFPFINEENIPSPEFIDTYCLYNKEGLYLFAGSRNRWITIDKDNFSFAKWAKENGEELLQLGEGLHYGEWLGSGIQVNYGLKEKRFYLFNYFKWADSRYTPYEILDEKQEYCPSCCYVVPILFIGDFNTFNINYTLDKLYREGSKAVPGYMNPEGIVINHLASKQLFKVTLIGDEKPKGINYGRK